MRAEIIVVGVKVAIVRGLSEGDQLVPFSLLSIARYLKKEGKDLPLDVKVVEVGSSDESHLPNSIKDADVIIQSIGPSPTFDASLLKSMRSVNPHALQMFGGPSHPLLTLGKTFEEMKRILPKDSLVFVRAMGPGTGVDPALRIIRHLHQKFGKVQRDGLTNETSEEILNLIMKKDPERITPGAGVMIMDKDGTEHAGAFYSGGVDTKTNLNDDVFKTKPIEDYENFIGPNAYKALENHGKI
jgi:hypothetical protein